MPASQQDLGPPWLEALVSFIVLSVLFTCAFALLRYICGVLCCCGGSRPRSAPPPSPPSPPLRTNPPYLVRSITYTTVVAPWEATSTLPMHMHGAGAMGGGGDGGGGRFHAVGIPLGHGPSAPPTAWPPPAEILPDAEAANVAGAVEGRPYAGYTFSNSGTNPHYVALK